MMTSSFVCLLVALLAGTILAATPTCKKINDCACTPTGTNVTGVINFFPLLNGTNASPTYAVNGTSKQTNDTYTFYYNPCVGFSVGGINSEDPCKGDLLCQHELAYNFTYGLGAPNATQFAYVNNVLFAYYYSNSTDNRTSEVRLICDVNETHGKFVYVDESKVLYYQFNFTSMCACPGKCPNKTMIPDKWVPTDRCSYRHARSGQVVNLQGLDIPLKVAIDEYTTYYYDPCNGLELGSLSSECKGVAVCKQDTSTSPPTYRGIGSKEPEVTEEDGNIVLHYPTINSGQNVDLKMICDHSANEPLFTISSSGYKAILRSKLACLR